MLNFTLIFLSRNIFVALLFVVLSVATLSACGKKGGLYLPTEPESQVKTEKPKESEQSKQNLPSDYPD